MNPMTTPTETPTPRTEQNHYGLEIKCMYCGYEAGLDDEESRNRLADHILTCGKSPLVNVLVNLSMGFEPLLEILQKRAGDEVSGWYGSIRIDHEFTDALTLARSTSKGNEVEALTRLRARQNELERENTSFTAQLEEARRLVEEAWREGLKVGHSTDNYFPDEWWPKSKAFKSLAAMQQFHLGRAATQSCTNKRGTKHEIKP